MANKSKEQNKKDALTLERWDGEQWVEKKKVVISKQDAEIFNLDYKKRGLRYKELIKESK